MAADSVSCVEIYATDAATVESTIDTHITDNNLSGIESVDLERTGSNRMVATIAHTTS